MAEEGFLTIARACKQEANLESVKAWLSSKEHWLLIIDNADDPTVDVSRLLPSGTKGAVLITTRNPDFQKFASAGSYRVDEMSPEDATALLLKTTALQSIEEKEQKVARDVVKTLGYLALAIVQAGAVIRQRLVGLDGFCELYSKRKKELLESGRPGSSINYQRSVYTTWEISVKMIEDIKEQHAMLALELLRLFSFMHHDGIFEGIFESARKDIASVEESEFSETLLVRMMPAEWDQLLMGKALGLLVAFSLITVDESRRISMHPLVHEWSRTRMPDNERVQAWRISVITLSRATKFRHWLVDLQQRKAMLPHIDAMLSHRDQDIFSEGKDLEERIFAAWKFGMAYRENCRVSASELPLKALRCIEDKFPANYKCHQYAVGEVAYDLEANGNYKDAIEIRKSLLEEEREKADRDIYSITKAVTILAEDYTYHGLHQKAIELCEATINEFDADLNEGSSTLLDLWQMLGEATIAAGGDPKRARKFLENALECYNKREYPERNFHGIEVLRRLAIVYEVLSCPRKAKDAQDQYIAQLKEAYGVDDIRTVIAVARCKELETPKGFSVRTYIRRRARGIASTKEAFENHRNVQGELHVATLACMAQVAWDYYRCGALAKAIALQEDLVKLLIQKWGEDHDNTTGAIKNLAKMRRRVAIRQAFYCWLPKGLLEKDWIRN